MSILEQKQEVNAKSDDERKPDDVGTSLQPAQGNGSDGNTEGSDVLMEEAQVLILEHLLLYCYYFFLSFYYCL